MSALLVSTFVNATDTTPRDMDIETVLKNIRSGGKLKKQIQQIRNRFDAELTITGDYKKAKLSVDALKKQLPAVTWSGKFARRANNALAQHSGMLCADLDSLGAKLPEIRAKLVNSPHVLIVFVSPTADGIKAVFKVPADASKHARSFRAVQHHVRELRGVEIDEACKDPARLCFLSYDSDIYVNDNAIEIEPLPEPETPKRLLPNSETSADLSLREGIAFGLLGDLHWSADKGGHFCRCPAEACHTTQTAEKDCIVYLEGSPTINCQHNSCATIVETYNYRLRSEIAKAEYAVQPPRARVTLPAMASEESAPAELPPPVLYVPPPLTLLPPVLQEYVRTAAESLNVDVAFIFLPLLSAIGAAIGNARSILLKPGYIQPPIIWTGILGPSGTLKSPSIETACFANDERERELDQQNREAQEIYAEDLAQWGLQKKSLRGRKPDPPEIKTCKMDDLTLEALADRLQSNPRGVLVAKDEISGFFESFDLYRNNKGADISRWLSLYTGAHFSIDRRTDNRHLRIWLPRVCITGGVQPKVFKRLMREDYFERGLPARFIFAAPPGKLQWSNSMIPDELIQAVRQLFEQLWLLYPNHDDHKQPAPMLLPLTGEAREEYIAFYNECGASAAESGENEAAAWSKLPGHGGRFALEGQLTCHPQAEKVTGEVMREACKLARWSGTETTRIYATLSETTPQREQRELYEFIERSGGVVSEREVMQSFTRLKNDKEGTRRELDALVRAGRGKWESVDHAGGPGRRTRIFRLREASTSTQFRISRGQTINSVDVDASYIKKIAPFVESDNEPVSGELEVMPTGILEL